MHQKAEFGKVKAPSFENPSEVLDKSHLAILELLIIEVVFLQHFPWIAA
jgi:hypothetical protein